MSSLKDVPQLLPAESSRVIAPESKLDDKESQQAALTACLKARFYDDDGDFKPLTHNVLQLMEEAKSKINEADALFIDGVRWCQCPDIAFKYLSEAEMKGCDHPVLYYLIGNLYRIGSKTVIKDGKKAFDYYSKSFGGTLSRCLIIIVLEIVVSISLLVIIYTICNNRNLLQVFLY